MGHVIFGSVAWWSRSRDLPCRWSRFDSRLSCFFFWLHIFFVLFLFFSPWLVSLYSYCCPITGTRGFCDKRIPSYVYITLAHSSILVHALPIKTWSTWKVHKADLLPTLTVLWKPHYFSPFLTASRQDFQSHVLLGTILIESSKKKLHLVTRRTTNKQTSDSRLPQ